VKFLVTAGPTQEAIDPVRFVSNRSTGKMGFAVARAAWRRAAEVRLVAGPSALLTPYGVERIEAVSAAELLDATAKNFLWSSALVMAAAVADFRPAKPAPQKLKKNPQGMLLELAPIADELPRLAGQKGDRILIGFAAETEDLEINAADKLQRKRLDLIVANDVSRADAGFAVDTNIVTIVGADGRRALDQQAVPRGVLLDALAWGLPCGVVCARAAYLLGWWDYYFTHADAIWRLSIDGLSLWGGLLGGGAGLVAACDVVVSASDTLFGFTEARLGIAPAVIAPFVLRKIGPCHARALFVTGERFDGRAFAADTFGDRVHLHAVGKAYAFESNFVAQHVRQNVR